MNKQDIVISKLLEIESKMDQFVTRVAFNDLRHDMTTQLEQQIVILQRLDQERVFTLDRVRTLEELTSA